MRIAVCDPPDEWTMSRARRRQPAARGGVSRPELSGGQPVVSIHIEEEDQVLWTEMAVLLDPTELLASLRQLMCVCICKSLKMDTIILISLSCF